MRGEKKNSRSLRSSNAPHKVDTAGDVSAVDCILEGRTFTVLSGNYFLDDVDAEAGRQEGWYNEARTVKNRRDVEEFILRHGGKVILAVADDAIVLGGHKDDAIVHGHVKGFSSTSTHEGVVRWSYVYALVHSLRQNDETCLVAVEGKPTIVDYLRRCAQTDLMDLARVRVNSVPAMRRTLDLVEQDSASDRKADLDDCTWRSQIARVDRNARWVVSCGHQVLWPYKAERDITDPVVVVYPDIFAWGFGVSSESDAVEKERRGKDMGRWDRKKPGDFVDRIVSCLPLLRVMGATVTSHFHDGVTHVLCGLPGTIECLVDGEHDVSLDSFSDRRSGREILDRVRTFGDAVTLVSPAWVRKRKWPSV